MDADIKLSKISSGSLFTGKCAIDTNKPFSLIHALKPLVQKYTPCKKLISLKSGKIILPEFRDSAIRKKKNFQVTHTHIMDNPVK